MSVVNNDPNILLHVELKENNITSYMADVNTIEWSDVEVNAVLSRIFSHREKEKFFESIANNSDWFENIEKYRK